MRSKLLMLAARAAVLAAAPPAAPAGLRQAQSAARYVAAVADKGRPEADTKRDADRLSRPRCWSSPA
jgi:predicted methyltransferase